MFNLLNGGKVVSTVNVYNEWDTLEEVIVGSSLGMQIPKPDVSLQCLEYPEFETLNEIPYGDFESQIIEETEEDLSELVLTLEKLKISVKRPIVVDHRKFFSTTDWKTNGYSSYCPRDSLLAIGQCIIEAPMTLRSRFFETVAYKSLLTDYLKAGSQWLCAPKPRLLDDTYLYSGINNNEPIFDAANILRAGRDLLYLVSNTGNELGALWLQQTLGDSYRVHTCYNLYAHTHVDSTIALLRPGLVLLNPERVNSENLPVFLKNWDIIWSPDMVDIGFTGIKARSSKWIGINLLMVNPNLAIVEKRQIALIKALEKKGIDIIPLQLRHARTLGGGFHCVTLDTRRKGNLEDYSG